MVILMSTTDGGTDYYRPNCSDSSDSSQTAGTKQTLSSFGLYFTAQETKKSLDALYALKPTYHYHSVNLLKQSCYILYVEEVPIDWFYH